MISWTDLLTQNTVRLGPERYSPLRGGPVVIWNITSRCNLNCQHCYSNATAAQDPQELTLKEAKGFIEDLSLLKVPVLLFSGGEPLLRKDIFVLAEFAKERGIRTALSTNGTLITLGIARKIKDAGFFYVGISMDGQEATHDYFRMQPGAFAHALSGIRNCKRAGLKVGMRFTLTKYNFRDLPRIFDIAKREDIDRLCLYHLVYSGRGINLKDKDLNHREKTQALEFIWAESLSFHQQGLKVEILTVDNHADGIWIYLKLKAANSPRALRVLRLLKRQGGNSSGVKIACVDNHGQVYPDQFWRTYPLGSLLQRQFSQIWQDKDNRLLQALRNRVTLVKGRCRRCSYLSICNGNLRARAEAVFGDIWQEDPACYLTESQINGK